MKLNNNAENPTHAVFGVATDGSIINAPISTFPHALITGATGAGKSVFINSLLTSMMLIAHPSEVKLIIIDPKGNEFGNYKDLPFMLTNPIIDLSESATALEFLVAEMNYRLQLFQKYGGKKDIGQFNDAIDKGEIKGVEKLPYFVLMIDELANLMSQYKQEVEGSIKNLGAMARASGMNMLLSTQTPRKEYVDGAIKANVEVRFALKAANNTESLVTLGEVGAEKLRKHGDFYTNVNGGKLQRGQAPYVEDDELSNIFEHLKKHYPKPDLVDIEEALDDAKLRYKKVLAENKGENPDDVTMENIKEEESSSVITPNAKQSSRSEEERQKAKEQHKKTMAQIEENKKNGNEGGKSISIDTSKFSFAERNKRRKEKGLDEIKSKSNVIPATSSKNKRSTETIEKATNKDSAVKQQAKQDDTDIKQEKTVKEPTQINSHKQETKTQKVNNARRKPTNTRGSVSARAKKKKRPTSSGGSPLARKR